MTLVTIMVPEDRRDKANGLLGASNGIGFLGASIFSGLVIGYLGMAWMLVIAIALTLVIIVHLATLSIPDFPKEDNADGAPAQTRTTVDIRVCVAGLNPASDGWHLCVVDVVRDAL